MSEETTKVSRVFAVDREAALAAIVTGKIELSVDVDNELKASMDDAIKVAADLRKELDEVKASAEGKDEALTAKARETALKLPTPSLPQTCHVAARPTS